MTNEQENKNFEKEYQQQKLEKITTTITILVSLLREISEFFWNSFQILFKFRKFKIVLELFLKSF